MNRKLFTPIWLIATLLALLAIMIALGQYQPELRPGVAHPKNLAAAGFIVLAAFSMGEFFRFLGVPALLGYLIAGILFGPNLAPMLPGTPEALFGRSVIQDLALINVLTVGVIGTMGGGELKLSELRENFKTIVIIVATNFAIVVSLTFVAVMAIGQYAPALLPFLHGFGFNHLVAVALMFAVFGAATSPTVTLAVLQDIRAKGRMTSLVLGIVVLADLVLVATFLLGLTLAKLIVSPDGISSTVVLGALPGIATEFGYALLVGVGAGLLVILYLRFIARETLLFTVAMIFLTSYVCSLLHAETLLAFLTAGFVVQNLSRLGHDMIHSLERISLPVFVIYFMTQAANLDLGAVAGYLPIAVVVSVVRIGSLITASRLGTVWSGAPEVARRHLWMCFFSLGSIDLVLAALVAATIPAWGAGFQMVIMAVVVLHILGGPPLLKLALDRAGETESSRAETREEADEVDRALQIRSPTETAEIRLPIPRVVDPKLAARLDELRTRALEHHRSVFVAPIVDRSAKMKSALDDFAAASAQTFERLQAIVETATETPANTREELTYAELEYHRKIEVAFQRLSEVAGPSLGPDAIDRFLAELRTLEPFGSNFRVEIEPDRLSATAGDGLSLWLLKLLRRLRRSLAGSWSRSVPLGRLYKYYVELSVPLYLERATQNSAGLAEAWWADLGRHYRRNRELFRKLDESMVRVGTERASATLPPDPSKRPSMIPGPVRGLNIESSPPTREELAEWQVIARELLSGHVSAENERTQALQVSLARWQAHSLERYTLAVSEPFTQLLDATERAGTMELPAFRYAPSRRFDRSRRAQAQLRDRLGHEQRVVCGHWGWMLLEQQLYLFGSWYRDYQRRIADTISSRLKTPCEKELEILRLKCLEGNGRDKIDWRHRLDEEIRPSWRRTERTFHRVLTSFGQGNVGRQLLGLLESRIAELPAELTLLTVDPDGAPSQHAGVFLAPVREWLFSSLVREIALRFFDLHERAQKILGEGLDVLEDVEQVVEFSLLSALRSPDPGVGEEDSPDRLAEEGLQRAVRLLEELRDRQGTALLQLERWILAETDGVLQRTLEPVIRRRVEDLRRAISRKEQASLVRRGGSWLTERQRQLAGAFNHFWREYLMPMSEVVLELKDRLADPPSVLPTEELRRRLGVAPPSGARPPAAYRRLFAPLPLEVPEFYVSRPEPELQLLESVREWGKGRPMSVLVAGDRGVGKRSLVHHVIAAAQREEDVLLGVEVKNVILEPDVVNEGEIVSRLGAAMIGRAARDFEDLRRGIRQAEARSVVVLENGEKLFARTEEGFETFKAVMQLVADSRERVLWIVLMRGAAMRWLQSALGVRELFSEVVDVPPFDTQRLVRMIQQRHRVSGFSVVFDRADRAWPGVFGRVFDSGPVLREPTGEFFDDLALVSGGNPLLALELWLGAIRPDERDEQLLHVVPLVGRPTSLVEGLGEPKPLILSLLAQHGSLSLGELDRIFSGLGIKEVGSHLSHLARIGFVEIASGQTAFRLRPMAEALTVRELRERGWL